MYTINHADCVKKWINRTPPIHVTDNELCAGVWNVGGRDTCTGDSGGPVYHNGVVVGIVAWGDNECRSEYPGVYASVSYFRHWIDWNTAPNLSAAAPKSARIVGGEPTTIDRYPDMVQVLKLFPFRYVFWCGGVILNSRAVLSAAHCTEKASPIAHQVRVGTSFSNGTGSLGTFRTRRIINHPNFPWQFDHDICIILLRQAIPVTPITQIATIAGPNYHLADNEPVWTIGWGLQDYYDHYSAPEQLHHVQVYSINQEDCVERYLNRIYQGKPDPLYVTDNQLCTGVWNIGGRDACSGDSGGPVYHNGVVVGIVSWGHACATAEFPGVNCYNIKFNSLFKMRCLIIQVLFLAVATAAPNLLASPGAPKSARIVGGEPTTIDRYPDMVQVLKLWPFITYAMWCGGLIINSRAVLTAAHCVEWDAPITRQVRVGTSYWNGTGASGVFRVRRMITHPDFKYNFDHDISIILLRQAIPVTPVSKIASLARPNYYLPDNAPVWTIGWGRTNYTDGDSVTEQLHHVQVYTINQEDCVERYLNRTYKGKPEPLYVTDNQLCTGIWNVGGRDACVGDSGGPVYHNGVVVGIVSWGHACATAEFPGVNVRVSRFWNWIDRNSR
ncbi:hypothetical protein ABMA27_015526 [Loxostege sticticalis]|uniref:Peptidase S1 domain-containing protein n=1 Tax=Loxostege sticticalis TaxID=481309 RepID=A0ABR3I806_LOXSC